jgi:hypothetical protein
MEGIMATSAEKLHYPVVEAAIDTVAGWVRLWRDAVAANQQFSGCDAAEIGRMAHEFGLSASELKDLTRQGTDAAEALPKMMKALGLDAETVGRAHPDVMRDLQRLCSMCDHKAECRNDLTNGRAAERYHGYCANADTLDDLRVH